MDARARLRSARITPRKARRVAAVIRGLPVPAAEARLRALAPRGARLFAKILKSAVANAAVRRSTASSSLRVASVRVDEGPRLKRWLPRARGRADRLLRRTSHLEVIVSDGAPASSETKSAAPRDTVMTRLAEELAPDELREEREDLRLAPVPGTSAESPKPGRTDGTAKPLLTRKHGD